MAPGTDITGSRVVPQRLIPCLTDPIQTLQLIPLKELDSNDAYSK